MKTLKKYIHTTIIASSLIFTACGNDDNEPVYGSDINIEATAIPQAYESCLNLISPKAYNDADGLYMESSSVVSMITPTSSTPYWDAIKKGAFQAIEDINTALGYSGKDRITLSFNTASNVDDQINILDSELSRYPAAMAIVPLDSTAFGMQFDQAMENGIPIISFEASTDNHVSATVATDQVAATKELISNFNNLSETPESYFIISSNLSNEVNQSRYEATISYSSQETKDTQPTVDFANLDMIYEEMYLYEQSLQTTSDDLESDEITVDEAEVTSSDTEDSEDTPIKHQYSLVDTVTYLLNAHPECKNILILDGNAGELLLETLDSFEFDYSDYNLLSFDSSTYLLSALAEEKIDGLQITNPYGIGYASIIASIRASLDIGNEAFVSAGHIFIDRDSATNDINSDFFY